MLKRLKNTKAQVFTVEYAMTMLLIVTTFSVMSIYIKRTIQAGLRNARGGVIALTRNISVNDYNGVLYYEYEPYYVNRATRTAGISSQTERLLQDGITQKETQVSRKTNILSETFASVNYMATTP